MARYFLSGLNAVTAGKLFNRRGRHRLKEQLAGGQLNFRFRLWLWTLALQKRKCEQPYKGQQQAIVHTRYQRERP
jgi:hypothetical protein